MHRNMSTCIFWRNICWQSVMQLKMASIKLKWGLKQHLPFKSCPASTLDRSLTNVVQTLVSSCAPQSLTTKFFFSYVCRNTVELEIRQDATQQRGIRKYVGPLLVTIQELDGTFKHTLQIEGTVAKADITCHSKSRRNKKKKIPLCTGEEVDMDLSAME